MDFQQIRDFVNPAVAQATGLQEVENLSMPVPVAYVPVQLVIDGALSLTSENPVQNKVIAVAIQNLDGRITAIEGQFSEGVTEAVNNWLDAHPEATTTVQDGAITYAKLDANLKGEVDQISELNSAFQSYKGGTTGQILRKKSNTDNDVEWSDVGTPTDEQVQEAVDDYLDAHPEQTTTVVDGSLTEAKFTAQTIVDFKNYVVTPQMYGAKADGTTDDTAAIQAALNAHKKVYFPQGTYKITEPLSIAYGQTIEGDSKYSAIIYAVGCDCFQIAYGDNGERGTIKCIHIAGNLTEGSKGIKLNGLASGWSIVDSWISAFDYGIYGYAVGHINNVYIDKCIITGKPDSRVDMTCGIYMPNSHLGQTNAVTIRDTEINNFKHGITIGGTAISVTGCTIQSFDNGIVIDSSIGYAGSGSDYCNTSGCTITGCYFEAFNKSAIYCNTGYDNGAKIVLSGIITGLQITNNYIYKFDGDNSYAVIRFARSETYGKGSANLGYPNGIDYAGVYIGMNYISKPNACKYYDIAYCLSSDSIFMQSFGGGTSYNAALRTELGDMKTGARMITGNHTKKEKLEWWEVKYTHNSYVTVVDNDTITINPGGVLRIRFDSGVVGFDIAGTATEYPANRGLYNRARKASDGLFYELIGTGFSSDPDTRDYDDAANRGITNGTFNGVGADGYFHIGIDPYYWGYANVSHNSISSMECVIFMPATKTYSITIKAPTIEYLVVV